MNECIYTHISLCCKAEINIVNQLYFNIDFLKNKLDIKSTGKKSINFESILY